MTKTQGSFCLVLLGIIAALTVWLARAPKWEYLADTPTDDKFAEAMHKHGQDGWELVFARRAATEETILSNKPDMRYEMLFKRPARF
jgi:hypothetical protein